MLIFGPSAEADGNVFNFAGKHWANWNGPDDGSAADQKSVNHQSYHNSSWGGMNDCSTFRGKPFSSSWDISVGIKVKDRQTDTAIS